jgi:RNA polymerase subunit RPABC4/transcription elongation factor Spt4
MTKDKKITHAILTDDMDGNLMNNDNCYKTYICKKCKREYIMLLDNDICPTCLNKLFFKKFFEKILAGR